MTKEEIAQVVHQMLRDHFVLDPTRTIEDNDSFLGSRIFDSIGFITLITLLEKQFQVEFQDDELVAENVDSISQLAGFISRKLR